MPDGYPGEGNLIIFNNNYINNRSAVFEIVPPLNVDGTYSISEVEPYGPAEPVWLHTGNFHTPMQGGAFRLPNGNTLITDCDDATIFEVTYDNQLVWSHQESGGQTFIARSQKYDLNYLSGGFPVYIPGDADYNDTIDVFDVLIAIDIFWQDYPYTPGADLNNDGSISFNEPAQIVALILGN